MSGIELYIRDGNVFNDSGERVSVRVRPRGEDASVSVLFLTEIAMRKADEIAEHGNGFRYRAR
jgi:hypothetical protein